MLLAQLLLPKQISKILVYSVLNGADIEQFSRGVGASLPKAARKVFSLLVHGPCGVSLHVGKNIYVLLSKNHHQQPLLADIAVLSYYSYIISIILLM